MGHHGERSRGDSRILDWPDATWRIVRESPDDPHSPRYLSALGRDVDLPEGRLHYFPETRRLTYSTGTRREARDAEAADDLIPAVLAYITANPGCSGEDIQRNVPGGKQATRQARDRLLDTGHIEQRKREGRGGGLAHYPATPPTPPQPRPGEERTPPTPVYMAGLGFDHLPAEPRHTQKPPTNHPQEAAQRASLPRRSREDS